MQLATAYAEFRGWLKQHGVSCSQGRFSVNKLGMHALSDYPCLKAKGHNSLMIMRWLATATQRLHAERQTWRSHTLACMTWGFSNFINILQDNGQWVRDEDVPKLMQARAAALHNYNALSHAAASANPPQALWPMKPKIHLLDHVARDVANNKLNATWYWTFLDEDFVGRMTRLAAMTHRANCRRRLIDRWVLGLFGLD